MSHAAISDAVLAPVHPLDVKRGAGCQVDALVSRAAAAQRAALVLDDDRLDAVVVALAETFRCKQRHWAERELEATLIGNLADKIHKLGLVLEQVAQGLHGARTFGRIGGGQSSAEYAAPMGVIFALSPLTNPVPNSLFKTLLCLKTRNALIVSYPRAAAGLGEEIVSVIRGVLVSQDLPLDLVQSCADPDREKTALLMRHSGVAMILATGGAKLVKEAYSSGKPAFGVGPGNTPVYVARSADLGKAARDIVRGKSYDNGIVCGSESNVIVDRAVLGAFTAALAEAGAFVVAEEGRERVIQALFDPAPGGVRRELIGAAGPDLLRHASLPGSARVIVIPAERSVHRHLTQEKMAPVLALFGTDGEDGIRLAAELLAEEGAGHTAVIHTRDLAEIDRFARNIPAGRILTNTSATHGMLGESADIPVSFMQGSGTWGGNSSTEPVGWRHLVNIKRLAFGRR